MDRSNHYEVAFEAYLQSRGLCYVAIDETRRAMVEEESIKSLDFFVFGRDGTRLVVDVKGRRFPAGTPKKPRRVWECWSFVSDLDGLERWSELAGPEYRGLLVFAYQLHPSIELASDTVDLFEHRDRRYLFRAVDVSDYRERIRVRSPRWDTVDLSRNHFRSIVRPFQHFVRRAVEEEVPF